MNFIIPGFIQSKLIQNKLIVENLYTNTIIELDREYLVEYSELLLKGCNTIVTELENFLIENQIIFNKSDISKVLDYYYSDNEATLKIIILPTEKCNFRCVYCYEDHDKSEREIIDFKKIYDFIVKKIRDDKGISCISIAWFGGEPLLMSDRIIDFNKKIIELTKLNKLKFESSITTNAYLLNPSLFKKLIENKVLNFQITVDGDQHDRYRFLKNGGRTKPTIFKNLKQIHNISGDFIVSIRVNLSESSSNNNEFYIDLKNIIGGDQRFFICLNKIFHTDTIKEDINYCKDNRIVEENEKMVEKHELRLGKVKDGIIDICYAASKNCYTIRPNGKVVKCTVELEKEWNMIGNTFDKDIFIDENNNLFLSNKIINEKCLLCKNITSCHSIKCLRSKIEGKCNYEERKIEKVQCI